MDSLFPSKVCWRRLSGCTSLHHFCRPSQEGTTLVLLLTGQKWVNVIMWTLHWRNLSPAQQQGNVLMSWRLTHRVHFLSSPLVLSFPLLCAHSYLSPQLKSEPEHNLTTCFQQFKQAQRQTLKCLCMHRHPQYRLYLFCITHTHARKSSSSSS